ncbi:unnamed protein product [Calicophoron daubneyi]|uniref:Phosphotransferase n=1 Tax=Calicophoron daubneyi TaxID=300641 RepID=A0AAV2TMV7_CALDB
MEENFAMSFKGSTSLSGGSQFEVKNRSEDGSFKEVATTEVRKMCEPFLFDSSELSEIMKLFEQQLDTALSEGVKEKGLRPNSVFVTDLSQQMEPGTYIVINFKGVYYSVSLVTITKDSEASEPDETMYVIPKVVRNSSYEQFFNYICETVYDFLSVRNLTEQDHDMAICISFPTEQKSPTEAYITSWTKEFSAEDVVGRNLGECFAASFSRLGLKITLRAIVNDAVSLLACYASEDQECKMGLIVGLGVNCCYFEDKDRLGSEWSVPEKVEKVVISTECGSFGDDGCIEFMRTSYDRKVDERSINPGCRIFEKMLSMQYVGELCRLAILEAIAKKEIFEGYLPEKLTFPNSFTTEQMCRIDSEPSNEYTAVEVMLREQFKIECFRTSDLANVRYICRAVISRAASLVAAVSACLIKRMQEQRTIIAVQGGLFRLSPTFSNLLLKNMLEVLPDDQEFVLKRMEGGSSRGALVLAAQAVHMSKLSQIGILAE